MLEKLKQLETKYEELSNLIADPKVIADNSKWKEYMKKHAELEEIVTTYREYKKVIDELSDTKQLL
ncbi:PCRF domain-containing protein, partial [Peptococcaceae bacterium]|nr:PCRF domain-containing protein [Peptococcaceae bacterium]